MPPGIGGTEPSHGSSAAQPPSRVWPRRLVRIAYALFWVAVFPGGRALYERGYANIFPAGMPEYPDPGWTPATIAAVALVAAGVGCAAVAIAIGRRSERP